MSCILVLLILIGVDASAARVAGTALWLEWWTVSVALPWFGIVALRRQWYGVPARVVATARVLSVLLLLVALALIVAPRLGLAVEVAWSSVLPLLLGAAAVHVVPLLAAMILAHSVRPNRIADALLIVSFAVAVWVSTPLPGATTDSALLRDFSLVHQMFAGVVLLGLGWAVPCLVLMSEFSRTAAMSPASPLARVLAVASALAVCLYIAAPVLGLSVDLHFHDTYLVVAPGQLLTVPLVTIVVLRMTAPMRWDAVSAIALLVLAVGYALLTLDPVAAGSTWPVRTFDVLMTVTPAAPSPTASIAAAFGWSWAGALATRIVQSIALSRNASTGSGSQR